MEGGLIYAFFVTKNAISRIDKYIFIFVAKQNETTRKKTLILPFIITPRKYLGNIISSHKIFWKRLGIRCMLFQYLY